MNNEETAKLIGKSRQMLEATISGKRNFGYQAAKMASRIIGGTIDVWQDREYAHIRQQLYSSFKLQVKNRRG